MAADESAQSAEVLAAWYWDTYIAPGLRVDGMPSEGVSHLRAQYVLNVVGRPHIVRELWKQYELSGSEAGPYVTASGRELSDADIEELSDEAERGYDVSGVENRLDPLLWEFDCLKLFEITAGELNVAAESNLTRRGVTRTVEPGRYRFVVRVSAATIGEAGSVSRERLSDILDPYGVDILVTDTSVKRLRKARV